MAKGAVKQVMATTRKARDYQTKEYGFLPITKSAEYGGQCGHVQCQIVQLHADGTVTNPLARWEDKERFEDLVVRCQMNSDDKPENARSPSYAWEVEYAQPYKVGLLEAEKMTQTLRRIEKGLRRIADKLGEPRTFGEYVARVALVLGMTRYAAKTRDGGTWRHTDNEHSFREVSGLRGYVDSLVVEWHELHDIYPGPALAAMNE